MTPYYRRREWWSDSSSDDDEECPKPFNQWCKAHRPNLRSVVKRLSGKPSPKRWIKAQSRYTAHKNQSCVTIGALSRKSSRRSFRSNADLTADSRPRRILAGTIALFSRKRKWQNYQKDCRFMQLPGEIRNMIYRYALVDKIYVQPQGPLPREPGLLHTCHAIKHEASAIFHRETLIRFEITDLDATMFIRYWRGMQKRRIQWERQLLIRPPVRPSWSNLRAWCRAAYEDGVPGLKASYYTDPKLKAAASFFTVVDRYRDKDDSRECEHYSWRKLAKDLEDMRKPLAQMASEFR